MCLVPMCMRVCAYLCVCETESGEWRATQACACMRVYNAYLDNHHKFGPFSPLPMQAVSDERIESPAFVTLSTACTLSLQCLFDNRCEEVLSPNCYCKKKKDKKKVVSGRIY